ncbi:hypothetical protein FH5_04476 [Priestia endophytica]|nr:hypothetical protein FH5_04476 [Priestia endophytica]
MQNNLIRDKLLLVAATVAQNRKELKNILKKVVDTLRKK